MGPKCKTRQPPIDITRQYRPRLPILIIAEELGGGGVTLCGEGNVTLSRGFTLLGEGESPRLGGMGHPTDGRSPCLEDRGGCSLFWPNHPVQGESPSWGRSPSLGPGHLDWGVWVRWFMDPGFPLFSSDKIP